MLLRSVFGTLGILCNFYAVDHLVLSDASMLNKMSPFFVIFILIPDLKRKTDTDSGDCGLRRFYRKSVYY